MEFEDRSNRKIPATLVLMSEVDIKASEIPSPSDIGEIVRKAAEMMDAFRNAKGVCWHVENVITNTFPPMEMHEPFQLLVKMHHMLGMIAVWAATMAQIHPPMKQLKDLAVSLSDTASEVRSFIKDLTSARRNSESLAEHCEKCGECRTFFEKFEKDAENFISSTPPDMKQQVDDMLAKIDDGGCN